MDMDRISHRGDGTKTHPDMRGSLDACMVGYGHMIDEIVQEMWAYASQILR